jgi:two-component system, OmpR family, sensor kinase
MKLRTRISLLTAVLSAIPTFALGGIAVNNAQNTFSDSIDNALITSIRQPRLLKELRGEMLVPMRGLADSYISIARYDSDGSLTILRSSGIEEEGDRFPELSSVQVLEAGTRIITVRDQGLFRVLAFEGRKNEIYVLAASLKESQRATGEILSRTALAAIIISLLSGILAWLAVSRFFKPVNQMVDVAHAVAEGDFSQNMPGAKSGTEFGELSIAINKMMLALRQFVSDASHELRTPLTVIRGYSEILQKDNIDQDQRDRAASRIETESLRMEKLVKDLLTLTRADSVATLNFKPINIKIIIEEYFKDLIENNLSRSVVFTGESSAVINCNEDLMRQLFSNIFQNILRHTPADSKVEINIAQNKSNTEIVIDDSGPGIPVALRNQVFERFTRIDASRSRDTGGFGLGMSIIKSVVDKHNGQIFLEDSVFNGLRVRLIFPN